MTNDVPFPSINEELRDNVVELYEHFQSFATQKGTVFYNQADIESLFEHGKQALAILCDAGLVVYDITTTQGQGVWRLPHYIDLRDATNRVREVIDLTLGREQPEESDDFHPHDPARHR